TAFKVDDVLVETVMPPPPQLTPEQIAAGQTQPPPDAQAITTSRPIVRDLNVGERNFVQGALKARLPKILYFPNLLSRFPEKIYLDQADNPDATQREINLFYLKILQDVLTASTGESKLSVKTSIHDRLKLGTDDEQNKVRSLLDKMGAKITEDIQSAWNKV